MSGVKRATAAQARNALACTLDTVLAVEKADFEDATPEELALLAALHHAAHDLKDSLETRGAIPRPGSN